MKAVLRILSLRVIAISSISVFLEGYHVFSE